MNNHSDIRDIEKILERFREEIKLTDAMARSDLPFGRALLSISDAIHSFRQMASILERVPLVALPPNEVREIRESVLTVVSQLEQACIRINEQEISSQYRHSIEHLPEHVWKLYPLVGRAAAMHLASSADQLREVENARAMIRKCADESKSALNEIRSQLLAAGSIKYVTTFANLIGPNRCRANLWLGFSAIPFFLLLFVAWVFYDNTFHYPNLSPARSAQILVVKAFILAALYSIVSFSLKNYRAHRHLAEVNQQKTAALESFMLFVNASPDPEVRNAVLLQTVESIYAIRPTGFMSTEIDSEPSSKILEITKLVGKQTPT